MNTNFTKNPIVGTPLTPSVIKQIHTAVRRYMPIAGNGIRTSVTAGGTIISVIPAPAPKKQKDKPLPFEVRYDGTLDSGAGGWKIYLPTEHLVQFDGEYLDPLNDVTPILDANGDETGWYSLDEITLQDAHVWLVISESSGAHSASFANAEDQQAVANICIAEVTYEAATQSTPETITIKQSVVGAVHLGGEGGGGEEHPEPFDIDGAKVVRCKIPAPEDILTCGDYTIDPQLGDIYVHVDRQTNGYVLSVDQASRNSSATHAQWLLYNYAGGNITCDCRPKVLPLFDLS